MKKMLNALFLILKWTLFMISIGLVFYIVLAMYDRLEKSLIEGFDILLPYCVVLTLFIINIGLGQKQVTDNSFYNITCCLVFTTIIVVSLRTIYDKNMILNELMGYNMNFYYFSDFLTFMKVLLYGISIANIFFMFKDCETDKKSLKQKKLVTKVNPKTLNETNIEVL